MILEQETNLCRRAGCPAACCRNMYGDIPGSVDFFKQAFPDAEKLASEKELLQKVKNQEWGIYYFCERGHVYFSISGDCSNLNTDLSCKIHGERFYPRACINMLVNTDKCNETKEKYKTNLSVLTSVEVLGESGEVVLFDLRKRNSNTS